MSDSEPTCLPDAERCTIMRAIKRSEDKGMSQASAMNRRRFAQLFGAGAAYLAARPQLSLAAPSAQMTAASVAPSSVVRLSANENPYGPSPRALKAMNEAFGLAWRYPDEHADRLVDMLAKLHSVGRDQVMLGDGSGEILKLAAAAFTGSFAARRNGPVQLSRRGRTPLTVRKLLRSL